MNPADMSKYRILLITALKKPWNNGWYYKKGFERNGHEVLGFDPTRSLEPEKEVFEIVNGFKPDIILHTKDEFKPDVFNDLRRYARVIQWYPDPVIPEWLIPYVKACDIFFTMSEGLVDEFKKYNPNVFWLTQAFEPSFFEIKEITDEDKRFFSSDVTFVGNLGSKGQYLPRRRALQRVIDAGIKFKWWGPPLPRKLSTIPLILGGLGKAYGGRFVWGEDYAKVARLSKIFLAFDSMPHIRKSMSARMYTAVGCGAFYMCRYVEGIEEVFLPDKEIVTFFDEDEMIDKIRFYLGREDLRKKFAQAGQKRVLSEHTYEVRIKEMMRIIEDAI
ncbi:MAG: hypothetical protein Fur0020_04300 [Thermodesulfovibrionia bacterium]